MHLYPLLFRKLNRFEGLKYPMAINGVDNAHPDNPLLTTFEFIIIRLKKSAIPPPT